MIPSWPIPRIPLMPLMPRITLRMILQSTLIFSCLIFLIAGCGDDSNTGPTGHLSDVAELQPIPTETPYTILIEAFSLEMPTGNTVQGLLRRPDTTIYTDLRFPGVILIPGGINPGRMAAYSTDAELLARSGMVVLCYNAEGRGSDVPGDIASEGDENYNGPINQDNLAHMIAYLKELPYVSEGNIGIGTFSFGITTGAGCLSRHPDLGVKYLADGEGPPSSFVTCHEPRALDDDPANDKHEIVYGILGHYSRQRDPSAENLAFWETREAIRFIGDFRGRYLRLQAWWDHAQPPLDTGGFDDFEQEPIWWHSKHATDIVNAAIEGGVPWVRVNLPEQGNGLNATYSSDFRPVFIPGVLKESETPWYAIAINSLARQEADDPIDS